MDDGTRHLVHRSVSTHSHDNVCPGIFGLGRNDSGMPGILSHAQFVIEKILVQRLFNQIRNSSLAGRSRNWIHDEDHFLFHIT